MELFWTANENLAFPILGGVFLSQLYLRVDYARKSFRLANASTSSSVKNNIIATCNSSLAQPNGTSNGTGTTSPSSTSTTQPKSGLSGGAIAGIVIGGLVGVALILGLVFLIWLRSDHKMATEPQDLRAPSPKPPVKLETVREDQMAELPSPPAVSEMDATEYYASRGNTDAAPPYTHPATSFSPENQF